MRMLRRISIVFVMAVFVIGLSGCGKKNDVVFTLNGSRIDRKSVDAFGFIYVSEHGLVEDEMLDEVYENGETYAEHYKNELEKDIILSVLLGKEADESKIPLGKEDKNKAKNRASELADKIGKDMLDDYGIDVDDFKKIYELKYHGNSYASSIGEEIDEDVEENTESEDAIAENDNKDRYIKVFQVTFPTVVYDNSGMIKTDDNGELIRISQDETDRMKEAAEDFSKKAIEGEDIETLLKDEPDNITGSERVLKYADIPAEYKSEIDDIVDGEVSGVISGEYGYYVVKLLDSDDSEHSDIINDYEINKKANDAKEKLYNKLFETYVGGDKEYRNDEIWDSISVKEYMKK